jgi:hypothetical protein
MRATTWHDGSRDETLKALWPTHSTQQIADALGVTRNAVIGRAFRLGLSKPRTKRLCNHTMTFDAQALRRSNGPVKSTPRCPPVAGGPAHPLKRIDRRGNVFHFTGTNGLKTPPDYLHLKPDHLTPQVSLLDLEQHHCRAVLAEGTHEDIRYCGRDVVHRSFCTHHAAKFYQWR